MGSYLAAVQGTDGDVLPVLRIGSALRERGHEVTLVASARYAARARRAGLRTVAIDLGAGPARPGPENDDIIHAVLDEDPRMQREFAVRTGLLRRLRVVSRALVRYHRPGRTVMMGVSLLGLPVLSVAEALRAPAVQVAIAPAYVTGLQAIAEANEGLYKTALDPIRAELGLRPVADLAAWLRTVDACVGLWPDWFERAGPPSPVPVRLTGFVLSDEDDADEPPPAVLELLAAPQPPILVTGGSAGLVHRRFYDVAARASAATGRATLLVAPRRDMAPDPLPSNVHWFPRLPFRAVMPRVAAVLHHGGMGSTGRALAAGTPQVILAKGYDRPDNARRLAHVGQASWLPEAAWSTEVVAGLLTDALATPRRPAECRESDAAEAVADELEELAAQSLPAFFDPSPGDR